MLWPWLETRDTGAYVRDSFFSLKPTADLVGVRSASPPAPFDDKQAERLRTLLRLMTTPIASSFAIQSSFLVTGAPGSGKTSLVRAVADAAGLHIVEVREYFDATSRSTN
jgi:predicted AAA+ superfamily ATPase